MEKLFVKKDIDDIIALGKEDFRKKLLEWIQEDVKTAMENFNPFVFTSLAHTDWQSSVPKQDVILAVIKEMEKDGTYSVLLSKHLNGLVILVEALTNKSRNKIITRWQSAWDHFALALIPVAIMLLACFNQFTTSALPNESHQLYGFLLFVLMFMLGIIWQNLDGFLLDEAYRKLWKTHGGAAVSEPQTSR